MTKAASLISVFLLLGFCSCTAVPKEWFSHRFHRVQYRLTDNEIKGLQFYLSSRVLAQTQSPPDASTPTPGGVVIVDRDTPGVATEVGRDRIKVTFRKGSSGVTFLSDTKATNDIYQYYFLATKEQGSDTIRKVADVPGGVLLHEGVAYTVAEGYNAVLMVDSEQLQELINKRKIGPGVEIK
jgi:hypothetical protein